MNHTQKCTHFSVSSFHLFLLLMGISWCVFVVSLSLLGWDRWQYLFFLVQDPDDSFMDFFNPIAWVTPLHSAYAYALNIYPPLMTSISGWIGNLFQFPSDMTAKAIRATLLGKTSLALYFAVSLSIFFALLYKFKEGAKSQKILFCAAVFFSAPFLSWIERGNYIILALIGSLFFLLYYKDKRPLFRHLAVVALAGAISVKFYPAVFGMFLLREKRWKDILYLGAYTAAFFFIPFLWLGGFSQIKIYLSNLSKNANVFSGYGYSLSAANTIELLTLPFLQAANPLTGLEILRKWLHYIPFVMLGYGAIISYFSQRRWQVLAVLCLLIVLIPAISFMYAELFMLLPLAAFIDEEPEFTVQNGIFFVLLALPFMTYLPVVVISFFSGPLLLDNFVSRIALLLLYILLIWEGTKLLWHKIRP